MSKYKILRHDIRCGLFRWRYLSATLLFVLICISGRSQMQFYNVPATWGDYLLYCFKGSAQITSGNITGFHFPVQWLLITGGCLFLNLDYLLYDLTDAGQQVIIRCNARRDWFLSKCVWNLLACLEYTAVGVVTVLLFSLFSGGSALLENTPNITLGLYADVVYEPVSLSAAKVVLLTFILPILSLATLSMLEMTLCLFIRPVMSFLACMFLLLFPLFFNSPLVPGIGAMGMRSSLIAEGGVDPGQVVIATVSTIIICVFGGCSRFSNMDVLGLEE